MQYSQEHLKTMVYAKFGGQTECIMGNWKIENGPQEFAGRYDRRPFHALSVREINKSRSATLLEEYLPCLLC